MKIMTSSNEESTNGLEYHVLVRERVPPTHLRLNTSREEVPQVRAALQRDSPQKSVLLRESSDASRLLTNATIDEGVSERLRKLGYEVRGPYDETRAREEFTSINTQG